MTISAELPIRRVRVDGTVDELGVYRPAAKQLVLARRGYPLLHEGTHDVETDVPWVFEELAPSGYLARRFVRWFPDLSLPEDRRLWSPTNVLTAVTRGGGDLPGNLVVGDQSHALYLASRGSISTSRSQYSDLADDALTQGERSSVGGERPKFTARRGDVELLVKFSPPIDTELGRRWADLLAIETHVARALRAHGVRAVLSSCVDVGGRRYLEVERFDRLASGGRLGVVTLYWLAMALYGETGGAGSATRVAQRLHDDGWLRADDVDEVTRRQAFSAAIGDTDAHLGNTALIVDDEGRVSLAPAYDILPMAFAPRHDELPDPARLAPPVVPRADIRPIVDELVTRVAEDHAISVGFREQWTRYIVG